MNHEIIKYELINLDTAATIELSGDALDVSKPAPTNWEKARRTLKRSKKTYGIFTEFSQGDLIFRHEGADFLRAAYAYRDADANVIMKEHCMKPDSDETYVRSIQTFDFSDYVSSDSGVTIPFKTGGLNSLIQAYLGNKFELERTTSIDGDDIGELDKILIALTSRKILLISDLETETPRTISTLGVGGAGSVGAAFIPNLSIVANSDQENIQPTFDDDEQYFEGGETATDSGEVFYNLSDVAKTITVTFDYKFRCGKGGMDTTKYEVKLYHYNNTGSDYNYQQNYLLVDVDYQSKSLWVEGTVQQDVVLNPGDSLRLGLLTTAGSGTITSAYINLELETWKINVWEDSTRDDSQTEGIFVHEAYDRLMQILTGRDDAFESYFYGRTDIGYPSTETYARTAIALGFWIRRFVDEKMELSLKDLLDATHAVHNTGYTIETVDGVEKLVVESMEYFFQNIVTIKLGEVYDHKVANSKEHVYSQLKFGYKNPNADNNNSLYDEAMGLDEYNTQIERITGLKKTEEEYTKISPIRADKYGAEFARRKPKINYPEEDTKYDKEKFFLDLKVGLGDAYVERTWEDDFEEEPQNVYSPETATNLRLSPANCEQRHQWFYGGCLVKHQDKTVRFSSSIGNSQLITKKAGEDYLAENGDTPVSDLKRPRFTNQRVTFKHAVDYGINNQVYGRTLRSDGRYIPNYYGMVEYKLNGKTEYGFLIELNPDGEGEWELFKLY